MVRQFDVYNSISNSILVIVMNVIWQYLCMLSFLTNHHAVFHFNMGHVEHQIFIRQLKLTTLEERRCRGYLIETFKMMTSSDKTTGLHLFHPSNTGHHLRGHIGNMKHWVTTSMKLRGHGMKPVSLEFHTGGYQILNRSQELLFVSLNCPKLEPFEATCCWCYISENSFKSSSCLSSY